MTESQNNIVGSKEFQNRTMNALVVAAGSPEFSDWILNHFVANLFTAGKKVIALRRDLELVTKEECHSFVKFLLESLGGSVVFQLDKNSRHPDSLTLTNQVDYVCNVSCWLDGDSMRGTIFLATSSGDKKEAVAKHCDRFVSRKAKDNFVHVISSSGRGLELHRMGTIKSPLESGNYSEEVLSSYGYVVGEYNKINPYGRLAIVNGPPGTGKTYLIKSMITAIQNSITILLPAKMVSDVDSPSLIKLLSDERDFGTLEGVAEKSPILFIIEDADSCLVPREDGNVSTISSMLNYTDGIFGSMLDLRIIATTNAHHMEFDKALTRPGRMCKHIYVGPLKPDQASKVYSRLSGKTKEYSKDTILADIYADSHEGFETSNMDTDKKLGFGF